VARDEKGTTGDRDDGEKVISDCVTLGPEEAQPQRVGRITREKIKIYEW
jgi:hypothetical protein